VEAEGQAASALPVMELAPDSGEVAEEHQRRMAAFEMMKEFIPHTKAPHLGLTVARCMHNERRRARGLASSSSVVAFELMKREEENFQAMQIQQLEFKAHEQKLREEVAVVERLANSKELLKKTNAEIVDAVAYAASKKTFCPDTLGAGHKNGGSAGHYKNRMEVLERLKAQGGPLSHQQMNDWTWFKQNWDKNRASAHGPDWGNIFAKTMQGLVNLIAKGTSGVMSVFMHNEWEEHLRHIGILQV
jgi:hypothetical protein